MRVTSRGTLALFLSVMLIVTAADAEVIGGANVRATFKGWLTPRALPRVGVAPVALHLRGRLRTTNGREPPQLERVTIAINRHGRVFTAGLPVCRRRWIEALRTAEALARCRDALIGRGSFEAHILIPEQAPFPARGRVLAFNSKLGGRRAILAHIYGTQPAPIAQVVPMTFERPSPGRFGTVLNVPMPEAPEGWGHVTAFSLDLRRRYTYRGRPRSLISAGCPAPAGFDTAVFPSAKGTYYLADGRAITRVVSGHCRVSR